MCCVAKQTLDGQREGGAHDGLICCISKPWQQNTRVRDPLCPLACDSIRSMRAEARVEWPTTLDVAALVADGWSPVPFSEFIIKIHSRCDLSCDYCYMYEMADQSWRDRPRRMTCEIAGHTAMRIAEHVRTHRLRNISVILHGGEPLLAGPELIQYLVTAVRDTVGSSAAVDASVQTNGVGLDDPYLSLFSELGIRVGVSLDGAVDAHNRHRRFPSGRGSHAAVVAGLTRLMEPNYRRLFSGLLCTIDLRNHPIETYQALLDFHPPKIDFLLPHGTWATPPPGRIPGDPGTPYADWLISIFDHWYPAAHTRIRLFEDIMQLLLGGASASEMVGLAPSTLLVIETDGSIEQGDVLKAAYHGAPATGLHVSHDQLDAALMLPGVAARQLGKRALSAECRACRINEVCGGGFYGHRYRPTAGFANPSVYCLDLMRLITHVRATMQADINRHLTGQEAE